MEIISREKVQKSLYNVYVATDGTEFMDMEECSKYEESAIGVVMAKIKPLIVSEISEDDIIGSGSCDCTVWVMKPSTKEDIDAIMQACLLVNPHLKNEAHKHVVERAMTLLQRTLDENDVIFVGRGYEMDSFWFIGTCNSLNEQINTFKSIKKDDENAEKNSEDA